MLSCGLFDLVLTLQERLSRLFWNEPNLQYALLSEEEELRMGGFYS